jgi:hypothetical protein
MTVKSVALPSAAWLIWAFLIGLGLPFANLLFYYAFIISDWTPFHFGVETGIWISRAAILVLIAIFLTFMARSALRRPTASKPFTGLLVFLLGIGCIGLGTFAAIKFGFFPGPPSFI